MTILLGVLRLKSFFSLAFFLFFKNSHVKHIQTTKVVISCLVSSISEFFEEISNFCPLCAVDVFKEDDNTQLKEAFIIQSEFCLLTVSSKNQKNFLNLVSNHCPIYFLNYRIRANRTSFLIRTPGYSFGTHYGHFWWKSVKIYSITD